MGKKIPLWQTILVFIVLLVLLYWGIMVDKDAGEGHVVLIFAAGFATIISIINGWKWAYIEQGILAAINRTMQAILILAVVGLMLGSWVSGGVVPSMMYYGIKIISPKIFLFTTCLLCSIVSLATGSSWSTAGSMGAALMGVGIALGFSPAMTAGAVVSGAYFGDKMSPLSDTTNLAPAVAGTTLFEHIGHMIYTVTPSLVIALIVYLVLGFTHSGGTADTETIDQILAFISDNFKVGILYLLPPVFVIAAVALKLPAIPSLIGGVILGIPFMATQDSSTLMHVPSILNYGWETEVPEELIAQNEQIWGKLGSLLSASGMQGMMWTISLILCAMCFGGVVDCTGMMGQIAELILKLARGTRGGLVACTIFSCIAINALCSDQYLAIILPGRMFKEAFEDAHLHPKNLSRCLEDSGTLTSNFFPWNTCGATMRNFLQVDSSYIPFAVLNWLNPLVSIFYGFTGITMEKMTDEMYERILEEREKDKEEALKAMQA